ncbi:hypothetical protein [Burkholderia sp. LMU1-1-1.1]|uniref:hypothetical protein n=1 Tax=Burkholderia sp. LMU1-1-1.1 TaxID=3135266 RepID=UPI003435C3C4
MGAIDILITAQRIAPIGTTGKYGNQIEFPKRKGRRRASLRDSSLRRIGPF